MKRIVSKETRRKISAAKMGHIVSDETKMKITKTKTGSKWSAKARKSHKDCHSGKKHYNWKGGRITDRSNGYIYLYTPGIIKGRLEHRVLAERFLQRALTRKERIHHINQNRSDNRLRNLYLFDHQNQHRHYHTKLKKRIAPNLKSNLYEYKSKSISH